jgi:uncharacterized protein (TIGR03435 family)
MFSSAGYESAREDESTKKAIRAEREFLGNPTPRTAVLLGVARKLSVKTFLFSLLAATALAQQPASPVFEVASVKINQQFRPNDRASAIPKMDTSRGGVTMLNVNLNWAVAWAYDLQRPQVDGPEWFDSVRYDIIAKTDHPAKESEVRLMLQTLLAERFKLAVHRETRTMDVMALVQPKSGSIKLTPSKLEEPRDRQDPDRGLVIEGAALSDLAEDLSHDLAMPVIDMTGLKGRFDFSFNAQKYVTALRSQLVGEGHLPSEPELRVILGQDIVAGELGLRLEPRKAPVETLVIDHVEKSPIAN